MEEIISMIENTEEETAFQKIKNLGYDLIYEKNKFELDELCCICDPEYLSQELESLDYESFLQGDENVYGFFIVKDNTIFVSCIINTACANVCENMGKNIKKFMEITLLCSNKIHRVKGLATLMIQHIKNVARLLKKTYIVLSVSNYAKNQRAIDFYIKESFVPIKNTDKFVCILK